jgi:hypothetical protein
MPNPETQLIERMSEEYQFDDIENMIASQSNIKNLDPGNLTRNITQIYLAKKLEKLTDRLISSNEKLAESNDKHAEKTARFTKEIDRFTSILVLVAVVQLILMAWQLLVNY